jgi:two-component sensor histidine kinase
MARRWQAADAVIASSLGLIAIVFGVFALLIWQAYGQTISQAEARATRAAEVVAQETRWVVASGRLVLDQLALDLEADPARYPGARKDAVVGGMHALPVEVSVAIYGANGAVVPGGSSPSLPANVLGTSWFEALAAGGDWIVTPQFADATTGEPAFALVRRLQRGGAFDGIVALTVDGDLLKSFWNQQNLGPGSTASIVREDGWIIARYPTLDTPMDLSTTAVYRQFATANAGLYHSPASPADGIARIVAFKHIPDLGLIVFASVGQDTVLGGLWTAVNTVLLLMGPIAVALVIGSFLTARLLRQGERTRQNLASALAHNEVLFREIHHRVKNNLQSVAALLQLQPIPREIKREMSQRIAAMSAVHEHIYRSNSFATVQVRDYLHTLIETIRRGHDPHISVAEEIEDVAVDKDDAAPLGLILNEVVSNAFKHAFPGGRNGTVKVTLRRSGDATGELTIEDDGIGFDPAADSRGIGRRLVTALVEQLRGKSELISTGTGARFTLTFPLTA